MNFPHQEALCLRRGPGLTVFQFVNSGAKLIDLCLNATYRGPKGPKDKIDKFFSEYQVREQVLDELYRSDRDNLTKQHKKLQVYCRDLLKYAHAQSHTVSTQLVTFKMLVAIITRYPGIRRLFYHPKDCGQVLSTFKEDWIRAHHNCGEGWNFYMNYTLHCLSDSELTALVEKELPSQLGRLELPEDDWNKVPIEELLSFCSTIPEFNSYTKLCAIRYLAGILELPTFWEKGVNVWRRFYDILAVLCNTISKLIQDARISEADVDVDLNGDFPPWMSAAREAVDILASATFDGVLRLHERNRLLSPSSSSCLSQLPNIVDLLQQSEMREAFPKASDRASRVDEILQRAERDIIDTPVNSPELTTPSTSISIEHDISTRLEEASDKLSLHSTVKAETLHTPKQPIADTESTNIGDVYPLAKPAPPLFALIIGINKYHSPDIRDLLGAVSDADAVCDYLQDHLGVPRSQIMNFRDSQATRTAIIHGIDALSIDDRITVGDPILVYYAGYGGWADTPTGWEAGGTGEIQLLVPYDYSTEPETGEQKHAVPDRTLWALLSRLASKKGDNITMILDCCHSGSGTQNYKDPTELIRGINVGNVPSDLDQDIWMGFEGSERGTEVVAASFPFSRFRSHVLLAACGTDESTIEQRGRGLFTQALLDAFMTFEIDKLTYTDLLQRMPHLSRQNPQCQGVNQHRIIFNAKVPRKSIEIRGGKEMDVMPDVGTAHSIAAGAEFDGVHSNKTTRVGLAFFAEQDKWAVVLCSDNYFNPRTWMYEIFLRRTRVWYRRDHTTMVEDEQGYRGLLHVGDINLDLSVVHGRMQSIHSGEGRAFPNPTLLPWGTRPWVIRVLLIFQQEYEIQLPKCSATELVGHIERRITSLSQNIIPLIE